MAPWRRPGAAWWLLCGALAAAAAAFSMGPGAAAGDTLDWQPQHALNEPWRWWTAAFVHLSPMHLGANLLGCVVVGAWGALAQAPMRLTLAWCLAWPLTHLGLLLQPELQRYGGLSGVLHAGVAVVAVSLVVSGPASRRMVGLAVCAALVAKVALEAPWAGALTRPPGWDIAVAPLAHASGALSGALLGLAFSRRSAPARD